MGRYMLYRIENALVRTLPKKKPPFPLAYVGSTFFVGIAFYIRWRFKEYWENFPFLLFVPAIFASALLFDRAAGLYATGFSAALVGYFFIDPVGEFSVNPRNIPGFVFFVFVGSSLAFVIEVFRHALHRIVESEQQKDLLLKDLAHRTKNDLMMITSIVRLQAREQSGETQAFAKTLADRIAAMAAVHDQLHRKEEHAVVCSRDYLESLCRSLSTLVRDARSVSVTVDAEPVELSVRNAVPIGLIVNELVTNALKYAFPEGRNGAVEVGFKMADPATAEIVVHDNGVGCKQTAREGSGSVIVRLMAKQLKGTFTRESADQGCRAVVRVQLSAA